MPTPGAARIVSRRSSASARKSASKRMTGSATTRRRGSGNRTIWRIAMDGGSSSGRRLLLRRGVEALAGLGHALQQPVRLEALAMGLGQLLAELHEDGRAHVVDVGERAARIGRETEADDRADIRLARIGHDTFLIGAGSFQGLGDEQAFLELLHVDALRVEPILRQLGKPRPEPLR